MLEAETRHTNPALFGPLGKYLAIIALIYQSHVVCSAPTLAQVLTPSTDVSGGGGREEGREGQEVWRRASQ